MSKPAAPRKVGEKEALAVGTMIRGSAQKLNLVAGLIRGRKVEEALNILKFSPKAMSEEVFKVLASAVANAENRARNENESLDVDELFVKHAIINEGIKMKRWTPAAMGRATPMIKRTSHVEIVVAVRPEGR
jgi:large subunit ribosomal protein L22